MATFAPGMATAKPLQGEVAAPDRAMFFQGLQGVDRTGGFKATGRPEPRAEHQPVEANQGDQHGFHGLRDKPVNNCCNSARTAALSAKEAALGNWRTENALRKRTT